MTRIHSMVQAFVAPPAMAGAPKKASFETGGQFDQSALREELARIRRGREIAFWICYGALVVVFAISVIFLVQNSNDPGSIKRMSAATGITVLGVTAVMIKLWQDKVKADLVLAMVSGMSESSLKEALRQLLDKL